MDFNRICNATCCGGPSYEFQRNIETGLGGEFIFQCQSCDTEMAARRSSKLESNKRGPKPDATTARVIAASRSAGLGLTGLNNMLIHADIKPINASVYYTHSGGVSQAQEKIFNSQMEENLKKEIELTLEMEGESVGYLDKENKIGVLIKVITDGSWQKRYGRNSLFGYGCMYGYYSGLPIYANHRCARCMKCIAWAAMSDDERPEGKGGDAPPPPHDCTRNWGTKAASNMEADIAVEGARHLLKAGAAIGVLICDGDTKTATAIRTQIPELKDHVVIWNDLNHMAINFGKNLREETGLSAAEAALLQSSFARAVKQAREEEEKRRAHGEKKRSEVERVKSMRKRIVAAIQHYFNVHTDCCSSWCPITSGRDKNHVPSKLGRYITGVTLDSVMPIVDAYTSDSILGKLLEACSSNTVECGNSMLWRVYLPKDRFRPKEGKSAVQRTMVVRSVGGEFKVQTMIEEKMGLASSVETIERREKRDAASEKKREQAKTTGGKIAAANKKIKRKGVEARKDKHHNKSNHQNQDDNKKTTVCTTCLRAECPRTRSVPCVYKKDYSKPKCPDPTEVLPGNTRIIFMDMEFQNYPQEIDGDKVRTTMEWGAVPATFDTRKRKWVQHKDEFEEQIKTQRFDMKNVKRLKQEEMVTKCRGEDAKPAGEAFEGFLTWAKGQVGEDQKWVLKGHNFVSADMRHWIEHLDNEKVDDPIKQLSEAGCVGIVDGMRFIKKHKSLTDLRHKKKDPKDSSKMVPGEPLGNGALYQLATTRSMEGNHLRPHRALDDAKAERDWTTNNTKLKALTTVLTQEKVVITLPQYRAYHEQYDKRSAKLKELGTHNKESS